MGEYSNLFVFPYYYFKNSNAEITHAFLVSSDPLVTHEPNQGDTTEGFNPLSEFLETINSSSQKDSDLISWTIYCQYKSRRWKCHVANQLYGLLTINSYQHDNFVPAL